jgi:hypothetical protein
MGGTATANYKEAAQKELANFYGDRKVNQADVEAKIAALREFLAPKGGMMVASADGIEGPEEELRALEYLYLVRNGFDE